MVSCAEDGSVMLWEGPQPLQTIPHPCAVWCVGPLPHGDFFTCGHDGVVRVFSRDASTVAAAESTGAAFIDLSQSHDSFAVVAAVVIA